MSHVPPPVPDAYAQAPGPVAPAAKKQRNVLGLVALIVAVVGFVFACIPGALIVGWVLLPIAFILGLISLFLTGKAKWQGATAMIVSAIGTIVGIIVFTTVVAAAFSDAFGSSDVKVGSTTSATQGAEEAAAEEPAADEQTPAAEAPAAEAGTRENPLPLGTAFSSDEWTVTVNSVTLAATDQVLAANSFNDAPDAGTEYILVNYTVQYLGDDPDGMAPAFVGIDYVTGGGNTIDALDKFVVGPDEIDTLSPLYNGASVTGNHTLQVPTPVDGVLAVRPGMLADKVFVAIQ